MFYHGYASNMSLILTGMVRENWSLELNVIDLGYSLKNNDWKFEADAFRSQTSAIFRLFSYFVLYLIANCLILGSANSNISIPFQ